MANGRSFVKSEKLLRCHPGYLGLCLDSKHLAISDVAQGLGDLILCENCKLFMTKFQQNKCHSCNRLSCVYYVFLLFKCCVILIVAVDLP